MPHQENSALFWAFVIALVFVGVLLADRVADKASWDRAWACQVGAQC